MFTDCDAEMVTDIFLGPNAHKGLFEREEVTRPADIYVYFIGEVNSEPLKEIVMNCKRNSSDLTDVQWE